MSDGNERAPDVLLHVPDLHVGKIELDVEDLEAYVQLEAQVLDLVRLQVGASASLGRVALTIEDVGVQAILKVRLEAVQSIVHDLMDLLREQPDILRDLTRGVGGAVSAVGEGTGEGVKRLGEGAGRGVENVGESVGEVGQAAAGAIDGKRTRHNKRGIKEQNDGPRYRADREGHRDRDRNGRSAERDAARTGS